MGCLRLCARLAQKNQARVAPCGGRTQFEALMEILESTYVPDEPTGHPLNEGRATWVAEYAKLTKRRAILIYTPSVLRASMRAMIARCL